MQSFVAPLFERLTRCEVQVFNPKNGRLTRHPIFPGRSARICTARGLRRQEGPPPRVEVIDTLVENCLFCKMRTPSTLFLVTADGAVIVPDEEMSINTASTWLGDRDKSDIQTYYELVKELEPYNRTDVEWVARTFLNLTPAIVEPGEFCVVTALNRRFHSANIPEMPRGAVAALLASWSVMADACKAKGLCMVSFGNCGRRKASGQSVGCVHGQTYAVRNVPHGFNAIAKRRKSDGKCPVCSMLEEQSHVIWQDPNNTVTVFADPAPLHSWSLLVVPSFCAPDLATANIGLLADAIQRGVRAWRGMLRVEPAWNLRLWAGPEVGHLFIEMEPRTETNVRAGYEGVGETVIDVDPLRAAVELGHWAA
jgi:galactose-1-phosphate uridylyltransferase